MAYTEIKRRLDAGGIVVLDGPTGTELQKRGATMDSRAWSGAAALEYRDILIAIHADYLRAGADVITANTFASSRVMLEHAGRGDMVDEINRRAVEAALAARESQGARDTALVAGSLSQMLPVTAGTNSNDAALVPSDEAVADSFFELAEILRSAGVDLLILEMMYDPHYARMAVQAAKATGLPVWFGLSARRAADGRILSYDHAVERSVDDVAAVIPSQGVDVAGCMHTSPDILGTALEAVRRHFQGPMLAYPESGYFEMPEWRFVDVIEPARLEQFFREWIAAGVQVIGGCCGLGIDHIEAAARIRDSYPVPNIQA